MGESFKSSFISPKLAFYCKVATITPYPTNNYSYLPLPTFLSCAPPTPSLPISTTTTMVATRRSLGGQPQQQSSSPPAAAPSTLSRAQQAALKKLSISGTDALKGDPKAAQAARDQVQTYHYRGAVYAADANTPAEWIENQPARWRKRDSIAVEEEEDEEEEPAERKTKRRKSMPSKPSHPHVHEHVHATSSSQTSASRAKPTLTPRAGRGGRQSLPAKRKAAVLDDSDNNGNTNNMMQFDYTTSGGQDDCVCLPGRLPENTPNRASRPTAIPASKSPLPDRKAMEKDIHRLKQEAKRRKYQVQPLGDDDIISEKDIARAQLVKLAKRQRQLQLKLLEWKQAKALLEAKKREAGLKGDVSVQATPQPEEQEANYQYTIDLAQSTSSGAIQHGRDGNDVEDGNETHDRLVNEQWERELSQTQPEIPESSPQPAQSTAQPKRHTKEQDQQRPQTPASATSTLITGPNGTLHPTTRGYTPSMPPPATQTLSTGATERTEALSCVSSRSFADLPPDAPLPTHAAGGDKLRWSIQRRLSVEANGEQRAEYAIDKERLEGESKNARRRRVERERAVVESWARVTGGRVVENR